MRIKPARSLSPILLVTLCTLAVLAAGCSPPALLIRPVPNSQQLRETPLPHQSDAGWFMPKIAVIDVDGVIMNNRQDGLLAPGENPVSLFLEKLHAAQSDKKVKAVVLRINSPGGTVAASDIMYHALADFRNKTNKPVIACLLDVAASGGYYLACGCDGIIAQPTTVTGSIGTIMQTVNFTGTMQKLGIKTDAIKSRDLKDIGSPLRDMSPEEREILQKIITDFYEQFLNVVLAGRKDIDRERLLQLADGRVFTADDAQKTKLIDRIGYPADAIAWAKKMAGIKRAKVVMYSRPVGYKPTIYATDAAMATGALINIELPPFLRAQGPQFLYLWQPLGNTD